MTTREARPPVVTRPLLLRCVTVFGAGVGFYLPLSVVPLLAAEAGSARFAGLATVALLLATVAGEVVTPRLAARVGYRWSLALGLTLLGAPTVLLAFAPGPGVILAVSAVRGVGFAICVVAGGALTAQIIPPERCGEGLAVVGLVNGTTSLVALPAGVWAAQNFGYAPVFLATAMTTLCTLVSVTSLPDRQTAETAAGHRAPPTGLGRPAVIFGSATAAVGVLVTFLPLAADLAWAALLAQSAAATGASWIAGRVGDRVGPHRLLAPGLVVAALGMAAVAVTPVIGALVFGLGFGVLQNATLSLMYARAGAGGEMTVSAVWNIAYDLGMAAGALGAGLIVGPVGYPMTFVLTAAVTAAALMVRRK